MAAEVTKVTEAFEMDLWEAACYECDWYTGVWRRKPDAEYVANAHNMIEHKKEGSSDE